jgi:hypothetical protein
MLKSRFPDAPPAEFESMVDNMMEAMDNQDRLVPTRFEDPRMYAVLQTLVEWVEESVRQLRLPLKASPAFGSLPTGQVNAMTVAIPDGSGYVVLFEDQLFMFALLFSKALARAIPLDSQDDGGLHFSTDLERVRRRIDEDPSVVDRFADVVLAYAIHGQPSRARQYYPEAAYGYLSDVLRESMETFVLGHEYGHVIAGHLERAEPVGRALSAEEVDEVNFDWDQEYEADYLGVALTLAAMNRERHVDASLSFWGADVFFSVMDVMDRAVSLLRYGDETVTVLGTHPPSAERRAVIRAALPTLLEAEQARSAIALAEALQAASELLWEKTRHYVVAAAAKGARVAPKWLQTTDG